MANEDDFGISTSTIAVRFYVVVEKLLLVFDLLIESKRFEFPANMSSLETAVGMTTYVESRRLGRRRSGE